MFSLSPEEFGILALSLRVSAVSVLCSLPLAILVAHGLARLSFPGKTLVDAIIHLPLVLPPVVVGFALLVLFGKRGPIGSVLDEWFGIVFAFRWTGAALASAIMGFPLMVRAIRLSIEAIDRRLEVAARTLGGSRPWVFASITLPLALPGIVTGTLLSFARGLGEFGATITFVSNIPGETQTLPLAIYTFTQVPGGDAQALRLSIVAVVLSIVALAASEWLTHRSGGCTTMIDVDIEQQLGAFRLSVRFAAEAPIVGLFGRSGSGKTSVINAIAGIATPRRGSIRVNGVCLFDAALGIDLPPPERRIGYVFQDALLFPHMDVKSNLLYGQRLRAPGDRFIEESRVIELLGLHALLRRKPKTLSGGERQRVAIGRALLAQPRILLMDEPLAALDVPRKTEILDYIERLRDQLGIPIVYVTHSVPEIARLADTVVVLSNGSCLAVGDVDQVMGRLDLKPATGRYEAGSLLDTHVTAQDSDDQLTTLGFDGGELIVPHLEAPIGERVRARIRARDVSLCIRKPADISILNVLPARVFAIDAETGPIVDVQLAIGSATIVARITRRSFRQLDIHRGQELHALVKAVSLDQRSVGYA